MRYSIYDEDGEKYIHFHGYFYITESDDDLCARDLEYCFAIMPLSEFLLCRDDLSDVLSEYKEYIEDITEKEAYRRMANYYDGNNPAGTLLTLKDVTMETPCGHYREGDKLWD